MASLSGAIVRWIADSWFMSALTPHSTSDSVALKLFCGSIWMSASDSATLKPRWSKRPYGQLNEYAAERVNNMQHTKRSRHITATVFLAVLSCSVWPCASGCHTARPAQLVSAGQPIVSRSPTGIEVDLNVTNMSSRPLFVAARLEAKGPTQQWLGDAGHHTPAATRAVVLRSPGTNATFHITLDGDFSVCRVRLDCREGGGWRERAYMKLFSQERVLTIGQHVWPWHRVLTTEEVSP